VSKAGGLRVWVGTNPMLLHYLGRLRWTRSMPGVELNRGGARGKEVFLDSFLIDSPYRRRKLAFKRSGKSRLPIYPVTSKQFTIDREAEEALRDFSLDIDDLWQREVHKAIRAEIAREGAYATDLASATL